MDVDTKAVASTALLLWIKSGLLTMDEFNKSMAKSNRELLNLLNEKMDKLDFDVLREKIKECMIEDK